MTHRQQNWERILSELRKAVRTLDGPIEGHAWSEYSEDMKEMFASQIETILKAELDHRLGDEWKVNVKIQEALVAIGEELTRSVARGRAGEEGYNV